MTLAAREYDAKLDCERLGLHPYLPQMRKSWLPRGATKPMLRCVPLFPRYLFVPIGEARARQLHYVRGLAAISLCSRPWKGGSGKRRAQSSSRSRAPRTRAASTKSRLCSAIACG